MKKLWILASALLLSNLIFFTSCTEDEGTGNDLAPLVQLTDGPTPDVVVGHDATTTITVEVTKGTAQLKAFRVLEGSDAVDFSRLTIDGSAAAANPVLLVGADKDGFTKEIKIDVHDSHETKTYTVRVEDENGLTDEVTFDVTVEEEIEFSANGILFNQAGPAGTGAIDLDSGDGTGTNDPEADLRDLGIDSTSTDPVTEWRQRVGGINGSEVRYLGNDATNTELDFTKVASKEAIEKAFTDADALAAANTITSTDGIQGWGDFKVSHRIAVNDIFVVSANSKYYLVHVDDVVVTSADPNDNSDHYILSIKY